MTIARISCSTFTDPVWPSAMAAVWADEVAVFRFFLPDYSTNIARLYALLQPEEQQRADRYRQVSDRQRHIAGRGLLRILMGLYLSQPPAGVVIDVGPNQKPELTNHPDWHINVAHAGNWVLIAVGRVPVGIDVEEYKPDFPVASLLPVTFGLTEQQHILESDDAVALFYRFWTRKEALLKTTGLGVGADLPAVPCMDGNHQLSAKNIGATKAGCWTVLGFSLPDGSPAAVAVASPAALPHWYSVDTEFIHTYFPAA